MFLKEVKADIKKRSVCSTFNIRLKIYHSSLSIEKNNNKLMVNERKQTNIESRIAVEVV